MTEHGNHETEFRRIQGESQAIRVGFLLTELQAGLTLLDTAAASRIPETRTRTQGLAREAYDTVERLLATDVTLTLSPEERAELEALHARLGARLAETG